jgi:type II secretory ATPase GspE/PulE/Tfp pilus assembly ATPase PilB-like protein
MRAALTGHLVIATLHAGSCRGVFERLLMLCTDPSSLWSTVELVLNQRLLRRVCRTCQGRGCGQCAESGYRGRVAVVEWLPLDESLRRRAVAEGTTVLVPKISLREAAHGLVSQGVTNEAELARLALL